MSCAQPAKRIRLAYLVSHPIQYQAPLLRHIAADPEIDLTVFFCSDFSTRAYRDEGFGIELTWDVPLRAGYRSIVLPRRADTDHPSTLRPIAFGILRALARGTDGQAFDAFWVHGYSTINALHGMAAAKLLGIPVLVRADASPYDRPRGPLKLLAKGLFFGLLRSLTDGVLAIGTWNRLYWTAALGKSFPAFLTPHAVDNDAFAQLTSAASQTRQALQEELSLEPGRPVILFASKLQTRKHCDHLLQAFLTLSPPCKTCPEPYLVIVGDGEELSSLKEAATRSGNTSIRFAGFRNQRELPRFFDLATVFVLPSRHEPWGLIINEAMASGLPVIVSDQVGCHVDLVQDGENGHVYPFGDIAALASALRSALRPGVATCLGQRSREIIAGWTFEADLDGLKRALTALTRIPLTSVPAGRESL